MADPCPCPTENWRKTPSLSPGTVTAPDCPPGITPLTAASRVFAAQIVAGPDPDGLYRWAGERVTADGTGWEFDPDNPGTAEYDMRPVDIAGTGPGVLEVGDRVLAWGSPTPGYYECVPDVYATPTKDGLVSRATQTWDGDKTTLSWFRALGETAAVGNDVNKTTIGLYPAYGEGENDSGGTPPVKPAVVFESTINQLGTIALDSVGNIVVSPPASASSDAYDLCVRRVPAGIPNNEGFGIIETDGTKREGIDYQGGALGRFIGGINWKSGQVAEVTADYTADPDDAIVWVHDIAGDVTIDPAVAGRPAGSLLAVVRGTTGESDDKVYVSGWLNNDPSGTAYTLTGDWQAVLILSVGDGHAFIVGSFAPNLIPGGINPPADLPTAGQLLWWDGRSWRRLDPPGSDCARLLQIQVDGGDPTLSWVGDGLAHGELLFYDATAKVWKSVVPPVVDATGYVFKIDVAGGVASDPYWA